MNRLIILSFLLSLSCISAYNRNDWNYPRDTNKDCLNTRAEILKARSLIPVTYKNKEKKCIIARGQWKDYYFDEVHTLAAKIEIDHIVPLFHAYQNGAKNWTKENKEAFANDPTNLVITQKKYNRQKGAKTFLKWMPISQEYACKYMKDWFKIKRKYKLLISDKELEFFKLAKCL